MGLITTSSHTTTGRVDSRSRLTPGLCYRVDNWKMVAQTLANIIDVVGLRFFVFPLAPVKRRGSLILGLLFGHEALVSIRFPIRQSKLDQVSAQGALLPHFCLVRAVARMWLAVCDGMIRQRLIEEFQRLLLRPTRSTANDGGCTRLAWQIVDPWGLMFDF